MRATLWIFHDEQGVQMRICERTTSARQSGQVSNSKDVMAYYVAKFKIHRVIHDFRKHHPFPKARITGSDPPSYRSILLIPLLDTTGEFPDTCVGLVSIDSSRPYQFSPGNGEELVLKVSPYCAWLTLLLTTDKPNRLNLAQTST